MTQFVAVEIGTGLVLYGVGRPDPDGFEGPIEAPSAADGAQYFPWQGALQLADAPTPTSRYEWDGTAAVWVERGDIETRRAYKTTEMSQCCADAILAGFPSPALGADHMYPAKPTDQANLAGSVLASFYPNLPADWATPFWCADAEGAWDFRLHTAAQIQQVGSDAKAAILACMTMNEALRMQIMAADETNIDTIHWPE